MEQPKQILAMVFKPDVFAGGTPHESENWIKRFNRYCSLIGFFIERKVSSFATVTE